MLKIFSMLNVFVWVIVKEREHHCAAVASTGNTWTERGLSRSILTVIFPGEPGLAGFIWAKDDASDGKP